MTDQIPAGKVRDLHEFADKILAATADQNCTAIALANLVKETAPPPKRPTLADMTEEERSACQWMQADTEHWGRTFIITPNLSDGRAALLDRRGKVPFEEHTAVTPRPDLPSLEWPDTGQEADQ